MAMKSKTGQEQNLALVEPSQGQAKRRKRLRLPVVFVIVICALFGIRFYQEFRLYQEMKVEVAYYQTQVAEAEAEYEYLLELKSYHFNDAYLERLARENLGMIKEGETLIYPMEDSDAPTLNDDLDADDIH